MKQKLLALLLVAIFSIYAYTALAIPPYSMTGGNFTTPNSGALGTITNVPEQVSAEGGNYTIMDIFHDSNSDNWNVFIGNVSLSLKLQGASGVSIYDFGQSASTEGYVVFATANTITWASVAACLPATCSEVEDTALSLTDVDNVNTTFGAIGGHPAINLTVADIDADASQAVDTNGVGGQSWTEVLLIDSAGSEQMYLGIVNDSKSNFLGSTSDYQVIVPTTDAGTRTYYVYAGIE